MICVLRMPSALAASLCPRGSELIPARTISAITDPLYRVKPTTTAASARYLDLKTSYSANT